MPSIDSQYSHWFPFKFNAVQQECLPALLHSTQNVVVSAPTGSGKTVLFELAMVRELLLLMGPDDHHQSNGNSNSNGHAGSGHHGTNAPPSLMVYICPTKSLCTERTTQWQQKLGHSKVLELTGDTETSWIPKECLLVVATPEKWEAVTRGNAMVRTSGCVKLLMLDEVHLLGERPRGAILEVIVGRAHLQTRLVAVSATIPNSHEIGRWLRNARCFSFGDAYRSVPLEQHVVCCPRGTRTRSCMRTG